MRLVHGVGINDKSRKVFVNGRHTLEYKRWIAILERCYSEKLHIKRPTYIDCYVSENFKSYSYFYEWCQDQIGFGVDGFELDKDLLVKGNKIYSEDTCVFIPHEINSMLTKTEAKRGDYPIGVSFNKRVGKFAAYQNCRKKIIHLGYFDNPEDAFLMYKNNREDYIKSVAEKYKMVIDNRAYNALINYKVEETD